MKKLLNWFLSFLFKKKKKKVLPLYHLPETDIDTRNIFEIDILNAINEKRKQNGIPLLQSDFSLNYVASLHSTVMAGEQTASHKYFEKRAALFPDMQLAEILSYNIKTANGIVNAWLRSKEHAKIMLYEKYYYYGVGIDVCKDGKVYVTALFTA